MIGKIGILIGLAVLGASELPISAKAGDYLQYGALGILLMSIVLQYWQANQQRKSADSRDTANQAVIKTIADRQHEDSNTLNETLAKMRENCFAAATRSNIQEASRHGDAKEAHADAERAHKNRSIEEGK